MTPAVKAPTRPRIRPTGDHVVIVPWDGEDVCEEGISIHERGTKLGFGVVLMVGPDTQKRHKMPLIWQGQKVFYNRLAGAEISLDGIGRELVLLREGDICGIMEEVTDLQLTHEREHCLELALTS